jgi:hypothetical protein
VFHSMGLYASAQWSTQEQIEGKDERELFALFFFRKRGQSNRRGPFGRGGRSVTDAAHDNRET